jgi:hypothetical protein
MMASWIGYQCKTRTRRRKFPHARTKSALIEFSTGAKWREGAKMARESKSMAKAGISVGDDTPTGEPQDGPRGPYITDETEDSVHPKGKSGEQEKARKSGSSSPADHGGAKPPAPKGPAQP